MAAPAVHRGGGGRRAMGDEDANLVFETSNGETSAMQLAVFPIISGRDVIVQAQSGTGKTSMIAVAVCQAVGTKSSEVQALILSPTRELAAQTEKVVLAIGNYINVQAHACIGGESVGEDIRKLEHGVHVVSGTPGTVCDIIKMGTLRTRTIKLLILDESDEMLSRGLKDQIYDVYRYLSSKVQVVLISATLPNEILVMTRNFMNDPIRILEKRDESTLENNSSGSVPISRRIQEISNNLKLLSMTPIIVTEFEQQTEVSSTGLKDLIIQKQLQFLNSATKEELTRLRGVGEARAGYILELREETPEPFKSIDDLKQIGMSEKQITRMMKVAASELFD